MGVLNHGDPPRGPQGGAPATTRAPTGTRWSDAGRSASDGVLDLASDDGDTREYAFRLVDGTLVLENNWGNVSYFE